MSWSAKRHPANTWSRHGDAHRAPRRRRRPGLLSPSTEHPRNDEERKHGFIVAFSNTHRQCDCQDMVEDEEELNLEDEEKLNPDDDEELNPDDDEELKLDDDDELNPDDDELNLDAVVGLEHADLCI